MPDATQGERKHALNRISCAVCPENGALRQGSVASSRRDDLLLVAVRPMATVPPSETLLRFPFSPPVSRLLAAASLQKRRELGCAAALRPMGSAAGRPP